VDVPVVKEVEVPHVVTVEKRVEVVQHHEIIKEVEVPQIQHVEGSTTHVHMPTAGQRQVAEAEVVHVHEQGADHPTVMTSTLHAPATTVVAPPVMAAPQVMAAPPMAAPTTTIVHAPQTSSVVVPQTSSVVMSQPTYAAAPQTYAAQPVTYAAAPQTYAAQPVTYAAAPTYAAEPTYAAAPEYAVAQQNIHTGGAVYSVPGHSHGVATEPLGPQ